MTLKTTNGTVKTTCPTKRVKKPNSKPSRFFKAVNKIVKDKAVTISAFKIGI